MSDSHIERRRAPRVALSGQSMRLLANTQVRVVDIGLGGVLLASPSPVSGDATLSLALGNAPFTAEVRLRPPVVRHDGRTLQPLIGATFVRMDANSRQALEAFLLKAKD